MDARPALATFEDLLVPCTTPAVHLAVALDTDLGAGPASVVEVRTGRLGSVGARGSPGQPSR